MTTITDECKSLQMRAIENCIRNLNAKSSLLIKTSSWSENWKVCFKIECWLFYLRGLLGEGDDISFALISNHFLHIDKINSRLEFNLVMFYSDYCKRISILHVIGSFEKTHHYRWIESVSHNEQL